MKIRIQKTNSGVTFTIQTSARSVTLSPGVRGKGLELLKKVMNNYHDQVVQVLNENGLSSGGFTRAMASARYGKAGAVVELEPWGFGFGTFESPLMGDSGSTPTDQRARYLLAYQAPLDKVKDEHTGDCSFFKDITV